MDRTPLDALARFAHVSPNAILFSDRAHVVTYAQGAAWASSISAFLQDLELPDTAIIALDMPVGLHVLFTLGAMAQATPTVAFSSSMESAGMPVDLLLSSTRTHHPLARTTITLDAARLEAISRHESRGTLAVPSDDTVVRVVLSSGTTGTPKPIAITAAMAHDRTRAALDMMHDDGPFLSLLDLASASGFHTLLACVQSGRAYINPGDAAYSLREIIHRGVTAIKASPGQIAALVAQATADGVRLDSLRTVYSAGGIIPPQTRRDLFRVSTATLVNVYGSTEAGRAAQRVVDDDDTEFAGLIAPGSVVEIVDEFDSPVPQGTVGVVRYRSAVAPSAYWRPGSELGDGESLEWFYPGDLGRIESGGRLYLHGRVANHLNIGGVKIDPYAVESQVLTVAGVRAAVGFAHAGPRGATFVLALEADDSVDVATLSRDLQSTWGTQAPGSIFRIPAMPTTANGKEDREAVAALYADALSRAARS